MGGRETRRRRSGSWNVLASAYHAFSGLMWVAPRTPSLRLGFVVVIALAAGGVLLRFTGVEIALLVLLGTVLLAVETLNTAIEMLCDFVEPARDREAGCIVGREPHAEIFARISERAGRLFWLNPEPKLYWNYGDSVMSSYERYCDGTFECWTTRHLENFVNVVAGGVPAAE